MARIATTAARSSNGSQTAGDAPMERLREALRAAARVTSPTGCPRGARVSPARSKPPTTSSSSAMRA